MENSVYLMQAHMLICCYIFQCLGLHKFINISGPSLAWHRLKQANLFVATICSYNIPHRITFI